MSLIHSAYFQSSFVFLLGANKSIFTDEIDYWHIKLLSFSIKWLTFLPILIAEFNQITKSVNVFIQNHWRKIPHPNTSIRIE